MSDAGFFRATGSRMDGAPGLEALFVAGSHGRGDADAWSDVDLVGIAEPDAHDAIVEAWRGALEAREPLVYWSARGAPVRLVNAITESWLRCDLLLIPRARFSGRARSGLRPLFDRAGIYDSLPADLPPAVPNPERVRAIVLEFLRVTGLMAVGLGRGEHVLLVRGAGLLRDLLTDLMVEECPLADRGGALHPSRLLRADQMAVLQDLPYPGPRRDEVIGAHVALAAAFLPRARQLCDSIGLDWPEAFEAATRRHLVERAGVRLP